MQQAVVDAFLRCPVDRAHPLAIEEAEWEGTDLVSGRLRCPACGTGYPVVNGIPRLLPSSDAESAEVAAAKRRESVARDADASVYDATKSAYETEAESEALLGALQVGPGETVLDLGAGTGRLTLPLAGRGATVLALDISPRSLEMNRARCGSVSGAAVHHIVADACYLPLRDGVAAKAASCQLLEHVPSDAERRRCIDEVHRVLEPGGRLAMTVYNYPWSHRRRRAERDGFHGTDLYYHRFDARELRRLLAGYRVRVLSGLLNLPGRLPARLRSRRLDRAISALPPIAWELGDLLFAVAERLPTGGRDAVAEHPEQPAGPRSSTETQHTPNADVTG